MSRRPTLSALLLLAAVLPAAADVVHLEGGRRLVGRVVDDGDPVRVEMPGGTLTLPRSRVERIERAELPEDGLARRFEELDDGDVAGALALAAEAGGAQLPDLAGRVLARAAEWAPDDERVAAALWRWEVFDRRLPANPDAERRLAGALGDGARILRSAHWRIAHDVTAEAARERADGLEAAWIAFHRLMLDLGLRPEPVTDRLEALLFGRHADWVRATGADPESLAGLNGLFVGPTGRILLFDPRTAPEADAAHEEVAAAVAALAEKAVSLDQQESELVEIRAKVEAFRPTPADRAGARLRTEKLEEIDGLLADVAEQRKQLNAAARELDAHRRGVQRFWDEETVAATMHEACHQIAFATGISHAHHPLWLNEGLATLFEATSRTALDPTSRNAARLRDVRAMRAAGRGGDLRSVVTGAVFATRTSSDAYAEAWSLTAFLVLRHPDGLARVLRSRPELPPAADGGRSALDAFAEAFGDLDRLEAEWRRFVERL